MTASTRLFISSIVLGWLLAACGGTLDIQIDSGSAMPTAAPASPSPAGTSVAQATVTTASIIATPVGVTPSGAAGAPPSTQAAAETPTLLATPDSVLLTHTVQSGETLFRIARQYGVTVDALRSANGLSGNVIVAGQVLVIPNGSVPAATTAAPTHTPPAPTATPAAPTLTPAASPVTPQIISFTSSAGQVRLGDPVTLTWDAVGETATLALRGVRGDVTNFDFAVPVSGSVTVPSTGFCCNYALTVSSGGVPTTATLSVGLLPGVTPTAWPTQRTVPFTPMPGCAEAWFFANPPAACPDSPADFRDMAAQRFERGLMIWTGSGLYIFFSDGLPPYWMEVSNGWLPGMPENDPSLIPPAGRFQPVRGFGRAWRDWRVSGTGQSIRDRLGWATEREFSLGAGALQSFFDSETSTRWSFLSGPEGVYVTGVDDSDMLNPVHLPWRIWSGTLP